MDLMSREDIERATDFVKKKFQGCPNCGALKVQIHDVIGLPLLTRQNSSGYSIDKLSLVALPLICESCGHITLFTAKNILHLE
jgi:transcription elongation factor Elf1